MRSVLRDIGFEVEVYRNLTSQGMNAVKRKLTEDKLHRDACCFLLLIISHGTGDNFLLDRSDSLNLQDESVSTAGTGSRPGTSRAWSPRSVTSRTWSGSQSFSLSRLAVGERATSPLRCRSRRQTIQELRAGFLFQGNDRIV